MQSSVSEYMLLGKKMIDNKSEANKTALVQPRMMSAKTGKLAIVSRHIFL
jgi:hypothetical protein